MKCPICSAVVLGTHICPKCNTNAYVFNKIFNISVNLFNTALEEARANNLTGAIALLQKSLHFNKNNTEALNLLGLLYYETGRLGEAVKQWILSTNINKSDTNPAFTYLDIFQKNIRAFEKLDTSVVLYNEAIQFLNKKNDDLAIIRLKKAININPKFIDALNLLALCYLTQGKNRKAIRLLNKVLKLDANNEIALLYFKELNSPRAKKSKIVDDDDELSKSNTPTGIKFLISFIFGVTLSAIAMYFLFMPDIINKKNTEIEALNTRIQENTKNIIDKERVIQDLQRENQAILEQLNKYTVKETIINNFNKINVALDFYKKGEKEKAISTFNTIDTTGFSEEQLSQYNKAKAKINP